MKKLLVLFLLLLVPLAMAQEDVGCCCDPDTGLATPPSFTVQSQCPGDHIFESADNIPGVVPGPGLDTICSDFCGTFSPPPGVGPSSCGNPVSPTPVDTVSVQPVKGEKALDISWTQDCIADSYLIERCEGIGCSDFSVVTEISGLLSFRDEDQDLEMDTSYTYQVKATYAGLTNGVSTPVADSASTGNLECLGQITSDVFCISLNYYNQYEAYLKEFGYAGAPSREPGFFLVPDFIGAVQATFDTKDNAAFFCNDQNILVSRETADGKTKCDFGTVCVADDPPVCIERSNCDQEGLFFGLGISEEDCEGTAGDRKFCFFDRSESIFNQCYACDPSLHCYDYKSEDTCGRNPCNLGDCAWVPYDNAGFTAGVCVEQNGNNCHFCDVAGTPGSPTEDVFSEILDQCTVKKAEALSTTDFQCFFDEDAAAAQDCSQASCNSFATAEACGSPAGGVAINPLTNELTSESTDTCGFQVCQFDGNLDPPCRKNADGTDPADVWPDCSQHAVGTPEYDACESDLVRPTTTFVTESLQGRVSKVTFNIFDRKNLTESLQPIDTFSDGSDYTLFICLESNCQYEPVDSREINIDNLEVKEGTETLLTLGAGQNTLRFFAEDPSKNREVSKTFTLVGCQQCDGPQALNVTFDDGFIDGDGTIFINEREPQIDVELNKPGVTIFVTIDDGNNTFGVTTLTPQGVPLHNHSFIAGESLPDGEYTFTLNMEDEDGIQMREPVIIRFVIDTTPPEIDVISFNDDEILGTVPFAIIFNTSERIRDHNVTLTHDVPVGTVNLVTKIIDLTTSFVSPDDQVFTRNSLNISDGEKVIVIKATDLAGNSNARTMTFFVDAAPPVITIESPTFGVSDRATFDFIIRTDGLAECRFFPGTKPDLLDFDDLDPFDVTGDVRRHIEPGFTIPNPEEIFPVHVECRDTADRTTVETLELMHLTETVAIQSIFASPDPVVQLPAETAISVELSQPGFCKYSLTQQDFASMENEFPGFGIRPDFINIAEVELPIQDNVTVFVGCENALGTTPDHASTTVQLELSFPFTLSSQTSDLSGSQVVPLVVTSNRDAFCSFLLDGTRLPFTTDIDNATRNHRVDVNVNESGTHTFRVECATPAGLAAQGIQQETIDVEVLVDLSAPDVLFVRDDSGTVNNSEFAFVTDQLRASWLANDSETEVTSYFYRLTTVDNRSIVDCSRPPLADGCIYSTLDDPEDFFFIQFDENRNRLNLSDQTDYFVEVAAQNLVGLTSPFNSSDGVTIDLSSIPASCTNGLLDADETAVDCGGTCGPTCDTNQTCVLDTDCRSAICNPQTLRCDVASCDDGIQNGFETGPDCGDVCGPCASGENCLQNSDCDTGFCSTAGVCTEEQKCQNGRLDAGETDVDCGGECPRQCTSDSRCVTDNDCSRGSCVDNFCRGDCASGDDDCDGLNDDSDGDGVPDNLDKCSGTGPGEVVNDEGCSANQRDTDGDGLPDAWEIRFGLDPNNPDDAFSDFDQDGLSNLDEFRYGTNPLENDSDGDGWSDYDEVIRGFDPNDPANQPKSKGFFLFFILLLVVLLALGGYFGYQYYKRHKGKFHTLRFLGGHKAPKPAQSFFKKHKSPFKNPTNRAPVRTKTVRKPKDEWIGLETLHPKEKPQKDIFSKLHEIEKPKTPTKVPAKRKAAPKQKNIFKKLNAYTAGVQQPGAVGKLKKKTTKKKTDVSKKLKELGKKAKKKK